MGDRLIIANKEDGTICFFESKNGMFEPTHTIVWGHALNNDAIIHIATALEQISTNGKMLTSKKVETTESTVPKKPKREVPKTARKPKERTWRDDLPELAKAKKPRKVLDDYIVEKTLELYHRDKWIGHMEAWRVRKFQTSANTLAGYTRWMLEAGFLEKRTESFEEKKARTGTSIGKVMNLYRLTEAGVNRLEMLTNAKPTESGDALSPEDGGTVILSS